MLLSLLVIYARAQWVTYPGNVLPPDFTSPFLVTQQTGTFSSTITVDPDIPGNMLLSMSSNANADNNQWRQNIPGAETATFVFRAKGNTTGPNALLDIDMDFGGTRWRIVIRKDSLYHVMNPSSTQGPLNIDFDDWNIYRFTKTDTEVNLYVNENETPVFTGAPQAATTNSYFRFGDGWGSGYMNTSFDWIVWDATTAAGPSALPLSAGLTGATPTISSVSSFTNFAPLTTQTYTIHGGQLSSDLVITPPANYQVSANGGTNWFDNASPLTLPQTSGVVAATTITVRLNVGSPGNYSGDILHTSTGAPDVNIPVTSQPPPSVDVTASLTPFSQVIGSPSDEQTYTISGADLTGDITITPPADYEVSADGTTWFTNDSPLILAHSSGVIGVTTIHVRLNASALGTHNGNIVHTTSDATDVTVAVTGSTVLPGPPEITITADLSSFTHTVGVASAVQTYTISAVNMESPVTIRPPVHYQISANNGTIWKSNASPLVLTPSAYTIEETTISVRMIAGTGGVFSGDITHASPDTDTLTLAVTGEAVAPVITGIAESANKLYVTPNPARDVIEINHAGVAASQIVIYNATGQQMSHMSLQPGTEKTAVRVSEFTNGIYLIEVRKGSQRMTSRFMKE